MHGCRTGRQRKLALLAHGPEGVRGQLPLDLPAFTQALGSHCQAAKPGTFSKRKPNGSWVGHLLTAPNKWTPLLESVNIKWSHGQPSLILTLPTKDWTDVRCSPRSTTKGNRDEDKMAGTLMFFHVRQQFQQLKNLRGMNFMSATFNYLFFASVLGHLSAHFLVGVTGTILVISNFLNNKHSPTAPCLLSVPCILST